MRVLVLGSTGFVGRHVVEEFLARGAHVTGWSRRPSPRGAPRERFVERSVDLLDASTLPRDDDPSALSRGGDPSALSRGDDPSAPSRGDDLSAPSRGDDLSALSRDSHAARFDAAVLLAGHAVPGLDFDVGRAEENRAIARRALEFLARTSSGARVVVMSSSHVYGSRGDASPIDESRPLAPDGAYGRSKVEVEALARAHAASLRIVIARSFHQIGPDMQPGLLIPDLIAALRAGVDPIVMRGPDGARDFLDVRDGARAIADLATRDVTTPVVVNVCSGRGTRVSAIARGLARHLGLAREFRFAPGDPLPFVGATDTLQRLVDFTPRHDVEATLAWIAAAADQRR